MHKHRAIGSLIFLIFAIAAMAWFIFPKKTTKETMVKKKVLTTQDRRNPEPQQQTLTVQGKMILDVPFTSQSPLVQWSDPEQNSACEEASMIMAWHWLQETPLDTQTADSEIKKLIAYENTQTGNAYDTSAADTQKIFESYFVKNKMVLSYNITIEDILSQLAQGNIVIVPTDGNALHNPHFKQPGPETHMLVIRGYDNDTSEFITNDPGTKYGENYRYSYNVLYSAIRDYPTGNHLPITSTRKAMLTVLKLGQT